MISSAARRLYLAFYRAFLLPPDPFRFDPRLEGLVQELCRAARARPILNLGSGSTSLGSRVVNVDLAAYPGVAVCGNGERLPFVDGAFSGVLLRGVLEHVRQADRVRAELIRVLDRGGFLYVEVPFLQPFHASPEDHRRFTLPGLRAYLQDFEEQASGVQIGPWSALAWVAREALASTLALGSRALYPKALVAAAWLTFWLKYLDRLIVPADHVTQAASALYFLARKRG